MEPVLKDDWANVDIVLSVLWSVDDHGAMGTSGVLRAVMA
jgi:hypothetical protein